MLFRSLFSSVGVPCQPREEPAKVPALLARLRDLAGKAGGAAPAPASPALSAIEAVEAQTGNAQLLEIYKRADDLSALATLWTQTAADIAKRLPVWRSLTDLLKHAKTLGPYAALKAEADAIESQRSLLAEPDPVRPLLDKVVDLLRLALNAKLDACKTAFVDQQAQLEKDADWNKLTDGQRTELRDKHHLAPVAPVPVGSPDQQQDALDDCDLDHWVSRVQALPSRFDAARHAAVQLLKPNVVHVALPKRTLNDEAELNQWLAEVRALLAAKIKIGPVTF